MTDNMRAFLNTWLSKKKVQPKYTVRDAGEIIDSILNRGTGQKRFISELRVPGYDYLGKNIINHKGKFILLAHASSAGGFILLCKISET